MTAIDTIKTMDQENKSCIAFCQAHYITNIISLNSQSLYKNIVPIL